MAASLQQSFMSQQASAFWLVFGGGFSVRAAAEIANAPAQAKLIKSTLTFLIIVCSLILRIAVAIREECLDDNESDVTVKFQQADF